MKKNPEGPCTTSQKTESAPARLTKSCRSAEVSQVLELTLAIIRTPFGRMEHPHGADLPSAGAESIA